MDEDESKAAPQHGRFGRMTRENKLALVVGFGLILIVGILISDHLSAANRQEAAKLGVVDPLSAGGSQPATRLVEYNPSRSSQAAQQNNIETSTAHTAQQQAAPEHGLQIIDQSRNADTTLPPPAATQARPYDSGQTIDMGGIIEPARPQTEKPLETVTFGPGFDNAAPTNASITFHDVRDREALSTICSNFYGTASLVNALAEFNGIADPNLVHAGTRLKLPATLEGTARRGITNSASQTNTTKPAATKPRTYTIKRGDTLSELAEKTARLSRPLE